jgi:hypothetical protein
MCFITHQTRTTRQAKDGWHQHQQAVLRNNKSDMDTLWPLARIAWAWRSRTSRNFSKSLTLISVGPLHLIAFSTAGILSSHTTVDNQVLLAQRSSCGPRAEHTAPPDQILCESYAQITMQASDQYWRSCEGAPRLQFCTVQASAAELDVNNSAMPILRGSAGIGEL